MDGSSWKTFNDSHDLLSHEVMDLNTITVVDNVGHDGEMGMCKDLIIVKKQIKNHLEFVSSVNTTDHVSDL